MQTRFRLKKDLQLEKERIVEDFSKLQSGKIAIDEIASRYNIQMSKNTESRASHIRFKKVERSDTAKKIAPKENK